MIIEVLGTSEVKKSKKLINALTKVVENKKEKPRVRRTAIFVLREFEDIKTIGLFIKTVGNENKKVSGTAVRALAHYGKVAMPDLIKALDDSNQKIRDGVVEAIVWNEKDVIPDLEKVIGDNKYSARVRSGCECALNAFKKREKDEDLKVPKAVAQALKEAKDKEEMTKLPHRITVKSDLGKLGRDLNQHGLENRRPAKQASFKLKQRR